MNTTIETALMISAGALLTAGASLGPSLGERLTDTFTSATPDAAEIALIPEVEPVDWRPVHGARVVNCQDIVATGSATISAHDNRGGYSISIVDGELREINIDGAYTLEEDGDIVRVLDPDGAVAFETSRSNPSLGGGSFVFHSFDDVLDDPFGAPIVPMTPAERAVLGVRVSPAGAAMAAQLGIDSGALVEFVLPGSGADTGGVRQFDVIVGVNGDPIDARALGEIISGREPGETVEVELIRNGQRRTVEVTLGSAPGVAPRPDGIRFEIGHPWDLDDLLRVLESRQREMELLLPRAPRPILSPRIAPSPVLRPAPPAPAPRHPDTTDAAEMLAPKSHSRSVSA